MKIAVTFDNGEVFGHFGRTEQFKVYTVMGGSIISSEICKVGTESHEALVVFLKRLNVDCLICGGIGGGAQAALAASGIKLYAGVTGSADDAAKALCEGTLSYDPNAHCDHHEEEHHRECCGGGCDS